MDDRPNHAGDPAHKHHDGRTLALPENPLEVLDLEQAAKTSFNYYGRMFLAGGFAGMCLIVTGHPLDTIKVRILQLRTDGTHRGGYSQYVRFSKSR